MATLSKLVGYECEFVYQVPEDYFCKQCKHVAREPNITTCCGECFCKACIDVVIQDKKPCPSCEETEFNYYTQNKYQAKILALKVCCTMKDRGCEWTGQLQHLDDHLNIVTGDCMYVDMVWPSDCDQNVECENSSEDCQVESTTANQDEQTEQNQPTVMAAATQEQQQTFEQLLQEQRQTFEEKLQEQKKKFDTVLEEQQKALEQKQQNEDILEQKIKELETKIDQQLSEQKKEIHETLEEKATRIWNIYKRSNTKDEQFEKLKEKVKELQPRALNPPYDVVIFDYENVKSDSVDSFPMYTSGRGYKFKLVVYPSGTGTGHGSHLSIHAWSLKGINDRNMSFPVHFTITVQLLNQHSDQDHYVREIECKKVTKVDGDDAGKCVASDDMFIPHTDLEWNAAKQTKYLKDKCLRFRITKLVGPKL